MAVNRILEDSLRLMETTTGSIGWAHPAASCGDEVMLLQGCTIPIILRRSAERYDGVQTFYVVGDSYVSGAMNGERWSGKEDYMQLIYLK